jgi:peptidoglycan hydrolase CwlO-like protein
VSTTQLQRAILWAFLATLIAWIRRPKSAVPPAAATRRGTVPVLANEPDGSVYDLNLKIAELQQRLIASETFVVSQQKRLEEAQREREALQKKLNDVSGEIKAMRTTLDKLQQAAPNASPSPANDSGAPASGLPGGAVPTPVVPAPAAPP